MNAGNIASSLFFFSKWYKTEKSHNFPETCLFSVTTVSKKRGRYVCKINICKPKAEVAFDFFLLVIDVHQSCFPIKRSRMSLFAAADATSDLKLFTPSYLGSTTEEIPLIKTTLIVLQDNLQILKDTILNSPKNIFIP